MPGICTFPGDHRKKSDLSGTLVPPENPCLLTSSGGPRRGVGALPRGPTGSPEQIILWHSPASTFKLQKIPEAARIKVTRSRRMPLETACWMRFSVRNLATAVRCRGDAPRPTGRVRGGRTHHPSVGSLRFFHTESSIYPPPGQI